MTFISKQFLLTASFSDLLIKLVMESNEVLKTSLVSFVKKSNLILEEVLAEFNSECYLI